MAVVDADGEWPPANTPCSAAGLRLAISSCSLAFGNSDTGGVLDAGPAPVSETIGGAGGGGGGWTCRCFLSPTKMASRIGVSRFVGIEKPSSSSVNSGAASATRIGMR